MLILLPPSETKRPGGDGPRWRPDALAYPTLSTQRERVIDALVALSDDEEAAARVLKLSARQRGEVAVNAALRDSPTMSAVDRYTGVLFDALDAAALDAPARAWVGEHVAIHSAPFGVVGALDPIPAYRLGAGIRVPGLPPMRAVWADAVGAAIAASSPSFVLDLRSEAYVALGPVPAEIPQAFVRPWLFVAAHMGGSWLAGVGALLLGKSNGWDVWTVLLSVLVASFGGAKILEMWAERWFANLPLPGEVKP